MSAEFELPGFAQPFSRDNQRLVCKGLPYGRSKDCFSSFEVLQEVFFKERLYLFFFSLRYICTVCVSLFNRWTDLHMIKLAFYFLSGTTALKKKIVVSWDRENMTHCRQLDILFGMLVLKNLYGRYIILLCFPSLDLKETTHKVS